MSSRFPGYHGLPVHVETIIFTSLYEVRAPTGVIDDTSP